MLVIYVIAFGSISVKTLMQEKWKFFKQIWNMYVLDVFVQMIKSNNNNTMAEMAIVSTTDHKQSRRRTVIGGFIQRTKSIRIIAIFCQGGYMS